MPQLDTIYTFLTFIWTWVIMITITHKVQPFMLPSNPQNPSPYKNPMKPLHLPWA